MGEEKPLTCRDCGKPAEHTYTGLCRNCLDVHYFDDDDNGDGIDPLDECGYIPGEGVCMLAGTEWCDWECPFNPCDPEEI